MAYNLYIFYAYIIHYNRLQSIIKDIFQNVIYEIYTFFRRYLIFYLMQLLRTFHKTFTFRIKIYMFFVFYNLIELPTPSVCFTPPPPPPSCKLFTLTPSPHFTSSQFTLNQPPFTLPHVYLIGILPQLPFAPSS